MTDRCLAKERPWKKTRVGINDTEMKRLNKDVASSSIQLVKGNWTPAAKRLKGFKKFTYCMYILYQNENNVFVYNYINHM